MAVVTMRQLLESGVHFGHQTRRWNPKMKRFIFTERNGIYIIDLQQSLQFIDRAYEFIKETVAHGGSVLYVGTKKQAQEAIAEQARRVGMPFVNQRWLGGMLTNFSTVYKRLQRLKELEEIDFEDVSGSNMTKKELLHLEHLRDRAAAAQNRPHASHQLLERERLHQVVVSAELETGDAIGHGVTGGEEDDRQLAVLPDRSREIEAVAAREEHVEDRQIGSGGEDVAGTRNIGVCRDGEPLAAQGGDDGLAYGLLVFDHHQSADRLAHRVSDCR